ncbi:MAG: hypothetical protein A2Y25_03000 [Candidatus Melainabacteria bacterium GWF2_37_15]|nr:MAG: hypothetical protein A2Y25_03000 [Candidatus Melainabacteria bacterium GWF2_37_15]
MLLGKERENSILSLICAGLIFTLLLVSYSIIGSDNDYYDLNRQNVDCTGLIALYYGHQYI